LSELGVNTTATVGSMRLNSSCAYEQPMRYVKSSSVDSVAPGQLVHRGVVASNEKKGMAMRGVVMVCVTSEQFAPMA